MQDLRDGHMEEIPKELMERVRNDPDTAFEGFEKKLRHHMQPRIPAEHQGAIINVGSKIKILDAEFEVRAMNRKNITLEVPDGFDLDRIERGGIVSIGPGNFRVKSFGRSYILIEGMPGTKLTDDKAA